jgi:hypothetical protein
MVTTNIQSFSGNVEVAGTLSVTGNLISTTGVDKVDLSTDTTNALRPVIFSTGTTGSQSLKTDPGITYNPSTKTFTLTDNITASNATVSDYLIHKDDTNTYLGFPADDTISFTTGGGEKVRITSTGNLGVGSAAPAYKLHVVGNTYVTSNLTVGTANLHVDTLTGNVGIGTTTPIFTLDVHGTSNVGALTATTVNATTFTGSMSQSLSNGSYLTGDAYDGSVARTFAVDATTDSTANKIVARDASGNVYADRLFTADYLVHEGDINTYFGFPSNDTITFTTTGDERMRVDQHGNVAIGTTSAPYKLNVAGTANVGALSATTVTFSDDLAVGTNKFFVDVSSSNVGIGTSEPAYKLDVHGTSNVGVLTGTTGTFSGAISVGSDTNTTSTLGRVKIGYNGTDDFATFSHIDRNNELDYALGQETGGTTVLNTKTGKPINFRVNNANKMTMDLDGKFGIGTVTPDANLDVVGNVYVSSNLTVGTSDFHVDTVTGFVGVGTTSPEYTLDVAGTSRLGVVALTPQTYLYSNAHYLNYTSEVASDFEQVLLQFDTGGTDSTDQSEYAGYIDVEMVGQRTTVNYYGPEIFTARVNYIVGWNEADDLWKFTTFVQENKSVSSGVTDTYSVFRGVPVFKYRYIDRKLQIYVSFSARWFRGHTSFTARVTTDAPTDVSMPGPNTLMASGTEGTAEVGMCYGVGDKAAYVGIGTTNPTSNLHVVGDAYVSSDLTVGASKLFVDASTGQVGVGSASPTSNLHVVGNAYVSSNLTVGTANLHVDTQTGFVGVGTTDPKSTLDVVGDIMQTLVINPAEYKRGVAAEASDFKAVHDVDYYVANGGTLYIEDSTGRLRLDTTGGTGSNPLMYIYIKPYGGTFKLPIGWTGEVRTYGVMSSTSTQRDDNAVSIWTSPDNSTWTQQAIVRIGGVVTSNSSYDVSWENSTPTTEELYVRLYYDAYSIGAGTNIRVQMISISNIRMRDMLAYDRTKLIVKDSGNVGIGITNPARLFHVQGDNAIWRIDRDRDSSALQFHRFPVGDYTTPLKGFYMGVNASASNDGEFFISDYGTAVSGSGATRRLTIGNTGNVAISSNLTVGTANLHVDTQTGFVGVGMTNPTSVFNTFGGQLWDGDDHTSKVCATLRVGRGGGDGASRVDYGTGAILEFRHESDYRYVTIESVSDGGQASAQMGLLFKTTPGSGGPVERMRIKNNGNVGIGTTNPAYTLDVTGPINLTSNIVMSGEVFIKAHDATNNYVAVGRSAGQTSQGTNAVAVGYEAGKTDQGTNAVAVGYLAGQTSQHDNTVVINASGSALNTEGTGRTYIKPLRVATVASNVMTYDQTTGEVMDSGGLISNKFAVVSEQPPAALTYNTATSQIDGHGKYVIDTSLNKFNTYTGNSTAAFDPTTLGWWSSASDYTNGVANTSGTFSSLTDSGGTTHYGAWASLKLPYKTTLRHVKMNQRGHSSGPSTFPSAVTVLGSNDDGATKVLIQNAISVPSAATYTDTQIVVDASEKYRTYYFSFPTLQGSAATGLQVGKIRLFTESFSVDGGIVTTTAASGLETGFTEHPVAPSNDGENWYKLTEFSGASYASDDKERVNINATTPYQYYRFVITNIVGGESQSSTLFAQWRLFSATGVTKMDNVLISGDLAVDGGALQTSHIKWPKVPLKANESEGYVASASSLFSTTNFYPYYAFNDLMYGNFSYVSETGSFSNYLPVTSRTTGNDTFNHEWLQIQLPQAITLSYFLLSTRIHGTYGNEKPKAGRLYASNDGITWDKITTFDNLTYTATGTNSRIQVKVDVKSTQAYKYYRLAVTEILHESGSASWVYIEELQLFESTLGVGTSATTAKLTVDGGLGLAKGSQVFAGSDVITEFPKHDRPLTKYPEVAMGAGTTGGYVASASSQRDAGYPAYQAFNNIFNSGSYTDGWNNSTNTNYDGTDYSYNPSADTPTLNLGIGAVDGEWLKLELPVKVLLQSFKIYSRWNDPSRAPEDFRVYGSNDNANWTELLSVSGQQPPATGQEYEIIQTNVYYKYFGLVVTKIWGQNNYFAIDLVEYFGTEEGDESVDVVHRSIPNTPGQQQLAVYYEARDPNSYSFADSTKVYDLSGSGVTGTITGNNRFDAEYNAWVFDGSGDYISGTLSNPVGDWSYSTSVWFKVTDLSVSRQTIFHIGTQGTDGKAIELRIGDSTAIYHIHWDCDKYYENLSLSENRWYHACMTYGGGGNEGGNMKLYLDGILLNYTRLYGSGNLNIDANAPFVLGSERSPIENEFTGSIANFRVYGKVLNADQVRELYEYDAERFGHRQNLVALHKGNLGVGVPNPTSRFEVAGADGLQEYPPKAMTGHETYIEGHGVFRVSGSSFVDASVSGGIWTQDFPTWYAFNKSNTQGWITDVSKYTDGIADSDSDNRFGIRGEWLEIEMPSKIKLKHFTLSLAYDGGDSSDDPLITSRFPKVFNLYKSNDGITWTSATEITTPTAPVLASYGSTQQYDIDENEYYNRYLIQVKQTFADGTYTGSRSTHTAMGEWRLFGTPAPSSLEDGHLTLGKALTLPRVSGHPTGAETPRAESLVVHYDTTVDSVVSGSTVVDISGNGNHATLYNGAAYSSTDRALTFDGVNDYLAGTQNLGTGTPAHTISGWFKRTASLSAYTWVFTIGTSDTGEMSGLLIDPSGDIVFDIFNHRIETTHTITNNTWYHFVGVFNGGTSTWSVDTCDVYINGVLETTQTTGTEPENFNLTGNQIYFGTSTQFLRYFTGQISNFKLWNVALTAEEVAQEYALGRTGKSLNLTDTALCLGGTVPRAQLDVRGSALVGGNVGIGTTSPGYKLDVHGTSNVGALTATSATVPNDGDFVMGGKPLKPAGGLHWDRVNSRLGVGTTSPNLELHVHDANNSTSGIILSSTTGYHRLYEASGQLYFQSGTTASADSRADINFTSMYASTTYMKILGSNGNVGIGTTSPVTPLHIKQSGRDGATTVDLDTLSNAGITVERSDTANRWIQGLNALNNYYFWYSADGSAPATSKAFFDENGSNNVDQNFTGQHRTFIKDVPFTEAGDLEGLIVSADQNKYIKMTGGIEAGSNAITTNESLPVVSLSTKVNDKKCFGVVSTSEDPETRANRFGNIVSVSQKELGDTRVYINSVGEGAMWVVNTMGSLESGDYITTSNVAGYGQRQDDDILHNYTVAKITMDCDFDPVTQPIQIIKKELTNVNYWVKTTVSNVTLEEYSNLAEENRTTELETYYTKDIEQTYTYKPIVEVTAEDSWDDVSMWPSDVTYAEWSNLEANVQNTYTLTYTQNDFETVRYEKTTVSNVSSEDGWDTVHIEPSTVTYAEWSNLEANVQNTFTLTYTTTATVVATEEEYTHLVEEEQVLYEPVYTKTTTEEVGVDTEGADIHTRTLYKKIEREESKTETEGYDLEVREELVNALDEHGQLQWEDDPSGATEKAYKIRYLDASGTQTDEANAVHIAAFVGVTYHCG